MSKPFNPVLPSKEEGAPTFRCIVCTHQRSKIYGPYERGNTCSASCDLVLHFCTVCSQCNPTDWVETPEGLRRAHFDCAMKYRSSHPQGDPNDTDV